MHNSENDEFSRPNGLQGESLDSREPELCKRTVHELGNEPLEMCTVSKLSRPTGLQHQGLDPMRSELCGRTTHELGNEFLEKYSDIAGKRTFSATFGETRGTG